MNMNDELFSGVWEKLNPKRAEKILNEANTANRKLRPGVVEKYAADMRAGKWLRNPQPIIFYDSGELADGQHRLWAIVESGATVPFLVVRGAPKEIALNLDTGLGRSLTDNAKIAGWDRMLSHRIISMAIIFHYGTRNTARGLSNGERLDLLSRYATHLEWSESHRPRKAKVSNGVIGAAIARAHQYERDLERLAGFVDLLDGKMPEPGDEAAHTFRNYVLNGDDLTRDARDLFLKSMNAIRYYMRRKALSVIKSVKDEAYPLKKSHD